MLDKSVPPSKPLRHFRENLEESSRNLNETLKREGKGLQWIRILAASEHHKSHNSFERH